MRALWVEVETALHGALASYDPRDLTDAECEHTIDRLARIEKLCAAARVRAASALRSRGVRDTAENMARKLGTSWSQARREIDTRDDVEACTATRDALDAGEVSHEQAGLIAGAAKTAPETEADPLAFAKSNTLAALREKTRKQRLDATDPDVLHGTAEWNVGTVPAGGSGSVTLTITVLDTVGCRICNVATITSPDQLDGARHSEEVCVNGLPGPRPALAHASGNAYGALLRVPALSVDQTLTPVASTQSGLGSDAHGDQLLDIAVPPPGGSVLAARVLATSSTSTITASPAQATDTGVAQVAGVNVMSGLVTADALRAVATATATGSSTAVSAGGTTFTNLVVNGVPVTHVTPNLRIDLPLLGAGSYVAVNERIPATNTPAGTSGGTYVADMTVNMIRVHIVGPTPVDIVVAHAEAHADFAQITVCGTRNVATVSGHAFVISASTNPALAPAVEGFAGIPSTGGDDDTHVLSVDLPVATTSDGASTSHGSVENPANAFSETHVGDLCLLPGSGGCVVRAQALGSSSSASASGASGTSLLVGVTVGTTTIADNTAPNTTITIPGVGFVVFNEQVCDNGADLASGCANGGSSGITTRAVHLVLLGGTGSAPGAEIIVAESHADAGTSFS